MEKMSFEKEFEEAINIIQGLVEAKRAPCTLEQILLEYLQVKGKKIPFQKLGYTNEQELIQETELFTFKDRKGKLYIELKKLPPKKTIKKTKSSGKVVNDEKHSHKISTNTKSRTLLKEFEKLNLDKSVKQNKEQLKGNEMQTNPPNNNYALVKSSSSKKRITVKQRVCPRATKSDSNIIVKKKNKTPFTKSHRHNTNELNERQTGGETQPIGDGNSGSTPLTQIKSLPHYISAGNGTESNLNFLELHLVNILHTKIMAHPNGFYAHELPEWYQRTFDRCIDKNWFDVVMKSKMFVQEKLKDSEILLYAKCVPNDKNSEKDSEDEAIF